MGFTRISNSQINSRGATTLPNQPQISAIALKEEFDAPAKQIVAPAVNNLMDELEASTSAGNVGAVAPTGFTGTTVQSLIDELATGAGSAVKDAYKNIEAAGTTFAASGEDTFKINAGSNVTITPLASPDKGISISASGGGSSTGDMLMSDYDSVGTVKSTGGIPAYVSSAISGKADTSSLATVATSGSYNDLSNTPTIPSALSDLTDDSTHRVVTDTEKSTWSGKSTVSWNQQVTTGQQIATVTIDGTSVNVFAPTGGGGGGGNVDSVNGKQGTVVLDLGDMNDVTFTGVAQNDAVVRNGSNQWVNIPLPTSALSGSYGDLTGTPSLATVATSGSYNDLSNKPTIPTVVSTYSSTGTDAVNGTAVASALGTLDVTDSAVSGQYVSAVSETDGKISVTRANLPTVPTKVSDLTNDSGYQTASDVSTAIAGKADSSDLDEWTAEQTLSLGDTTATFTGLSSSYAYKPFIQVADGETPPTGTMVFSGTSATVTFSSAITSAQAAGGAAKIKLRIFK